MKLMSIPWFTNLQFNPNQALSELQHTTNDDLRKPNFPFNVTECNAA